MTRYVGFAPMTMVRRSGGSTVGVYAGQMVPEDAEPTRLAQLIEEGFIVEDDGTIDGQSWQKARNEANARMRAELSSGAAS